MIAIMYLSNTGTKIRRFPAWRLYGTISSARYKFLRRRQIEGDVQRKRGEAGDEVILAIWRVLINGISYCSTSFRRAGVLAD